MLNDQQQEAMYVSTMNSGQFLQRLYQLNLQAEIEKLQQSPRYNEPKSLIPYGAKVYSQNEEDGIIREIFRRIGTTNKKFVEFGIGNGLENNTLALLFDNWSGLWIDASTRNIQQIKAAFQQTIASGQLSVTESFITKDNINQLIAASIKEQEIDLLSVDIDGNDFHILNAITCIRPRVIVIEYNAKFAPPIAFCIDYNPSHTWQGDDCFGVSLQYLEDNVRDYSIVGCNLTGSNAFLVRNDLLGHHFLAPFSAEKHYQPARYHLAGFKSGHPAGYQTLEKSLQSRQPNQLNGA